MTLRVFEPRFSRWAIALMGFRSNRHVGVETRSEMCRSKPSLPDAIHEEIWGS